MKGVMKSGVVQMIVDRNEVSNRRSLMTNRKIVGNRQNLEKFQ